MEGPSNAWIGCGFGKTNMKDAYSVIYGKQSEDDIDDEILLWEQLLANDARGDEITPCNNGTETCVNLISAIDNNDRLTVIWERYNNPFDYDIISLDYINDIYIFNNTNNNLKIIWAFGNSYNFRTHRTNERDAELITFSMCV